MSQFTPEVVLYTDGACSGNPGPGGWGFIMRHLPTGKELEKSGGRAHTTNNQMELQAVIEGLAILKRPTCVELVSDSTYVLNGLKTWIATWKKAGWKRKEGKRLVELKNVELWQELDRLQSIHTLKFTKIKGHSGHPENERADRLAVAESQKFR